MAHVEPRPEASTAELVKEAILEAKELMQTEVELAKDEVRRELVAVKSSAIALGAAAAAAILGLAMLLVAIALAIFPGPLPALFIGLGLLVVAAIAGWFGYAHLPKKPLEKTRGRLETDVRILKERIV